jgi:hypothetical protein
MNSRREFLKKLSSMSLLASAHGVSPLASQVNRSAGGGSTPLRWPKPIGSPVLESIRPAIENSRDVFTHVGKIIEVA